MRVNPLIHTLLLSFVIAVTSACFSIAGAEAQDAAEKAESGADDDNSGSQEAEAKEKETEQSSAEAGASEGSDSDSAEESGAEDGEEAEDSNAPQTAGGKGAASSSARRGASVGAGSYAVRLRDLEREVGNLKENVFQSKARLALIAENVLQGAVAGSAVRLKHINRMSSAFRLVKVVYLLDGMPVFERTDERGGLDEREAFDIYSGSVVPGEHTLTVALEYVGRGYGVFSYMKGYRFKVRDTYTFTADEQVGSVIKVVGYEEGGAIVPVEDRPSIRFVKEGKGGKRSVIENRGSEKK